MTTRTEEQTAISIAERCVVGVYSHGIGARLLLRERDVIAYVISRGILVGFVRNHSFEEVEMLMANGEMHI